MAKKKTESRSAGKKTAGNIAQLDRELVRLVQRRAKLVLEAAEQGEALPETPLAPALDDEEIGRLTDADGGPLSVGFVQKVVREVAGGCQALVHRPRIAFLGPLYSYSHLAAVHRFGQSVDLVPVSTIAAVFEEVHRKQSDFGLAPMENSTDGRVADTLDMFTRMRVRICGAVELRIHHTLLGKCVRTEVREVFSKPQALSQCRNWLAKHLPAARTTEVTSTSMAAELAAEKAGAAAIASVFAGQHYGLEVLAEHIEDNPDNTTRFAVIGDQAPPRTGDDRTAMLFQIEHRPGSLADVLAVFKRNRVNLTWIDSFPMSGSNSRFLFFASMEGHESDANLRRAAAALARSTLRLEILGSYPATTPVD